MVNLILFGYWIVALVIFTAILGLAYRNGELDTGYSIVMITGIAAAAGVLWPLLLLAGVFL